MAVDLIKKTFSILAVLLVLTGCSTKGTEEDKDTEDLVKITSTFSIMTDIVEAIGGEYVEVYNLVPLGTDPHDYDPKPEDIQFLTESDALFYNGLNLEGGNGGWLRSEEHTSELQSRFDLVCRLLLEKKKHR